jgi:hypothetical protein
LPPSSADMVLSLPGRANKTSARLDAGASPRPAVEPASKVAEQKRRFKSWWEGATHAGPVDLVAIFRHDCIRTPCRDCASPAMLFCPNSRVQRLTEIRYCTERTRCRPSAPGTTMWIEPDGIKPQRIGARVRSRSLETTRHVVERLHILWELGQMVMQYQLRSRIKVW